jgi:hypothetical protein
MLQREWSQRGSEVSMVNEFYFSQNGKGIPFRYPRPLPVDISPSRLCNINLVFT